MEKEILVKFEGEEWQDALNQAFKKANKTAKIDGFRPGKAPKDVFLKNMELVYYLKKQQRFY